MTTTSTSTAAAATAAAIPATTIPSTASTAEGGEDKASHDAKYLARCDQVIVIISELIQWAAKIPADASTVKVKLLFRDRRLELNNYMHDMR